MVGHTGVYEAIEKAVKAVDACVAKVVEAALRNGYEVVQIADHGNADNAVNADGTPANLQYIDFVKVQTAINHATALLGEVSTEVLGMADETLR